MFWKDIYILFLKRKQKKLEDLPSISVVFPLIWVWKNVTWEVKVFRYFNVIFFDTPFGVLLASLYISFQKNQYFLMSRQSRHWDDDQFPTLTDEKIIWFVTAFFQEWKITQINFSSQNVSVDYTYCLSDSNIFLGTTLEEVRT